MTFRLICVKDISSQVLVCGCPLWLGRSGLHQQFPSSQLQTLHFHFSVIKSLLEVP